MQTPTSTRKPDRLCDGAIGIAVLMGLLVLGLGGCDRDEGPVEETAEAVDESLEDARDEVEDAAEEVDETVESAKDEVEDAAEEVKEEVKY